MKTKVVSLLAVVALILGFAFIASAPAAPNASAVKAIPTATSQPGDTTASPAEPHPQIREALGAVRCAAPRNTWNTRHMILAGTASKRFAQRTKRFASWRFA